MVSSKSEEIEAATQKSKVEEKAFVDTTWKATVAERRSWQRVIVGL